MTEPTAHIRWEQETPQDINGYVGTMDVPMFQLWRTPCDYGDVLIGDWVLSSGVPKLATHRLHSSRDVDALKAEAERWLEEFTASIGAVFPEPIVAELRSYAAEMESYVDGGEAGLHDRSMFATGMRRAAGLIEHGDVPVSPDATETAPRAGKE
jgi:hypothetical protein